MRYPCKIFFLSLGYSYDSMVVQHYVRIDFFLSLLESSRLIVPSSTSTTAHLLRGLSAADVVDTEK